MSINITSYEDWLKKFQNQDAQQLQSDIAASDKVYDTTKTNTQNTYNAQIKETEDSYEDLYRENAVQRLINEREISENMANLGLTDSGLNRTQQTAAQLSYSNSKNKLDTSRQKAVDSLASDLAAKISEIEANKLAAAESIRSDYQQQWKSEALTAYNNEVEQARELQEAELENARKLQETALKEETARIKAQLSAQEKATKAAQEAAEKAAYIIKTNKGALSYNYTGSLKSNGVSVYYTTDSKGNAITRYVDDNSGKVTEIASNTNPYTFTVNNDVAKGAFSNGYQPNNIGGKKLVDTGKTIEATDSNGNSLGRNQKIFSITTGWGKSKTTKYYTWNGAENVYSEIKRSADGGWKIVQEKVGTVTKAKV